MFLLILAICMGSSWVSSQEVDWQRSMLHSWVQGTWQWQRIWLYLPR